MNAPTTTTATAPPAAVNEKTVHVHNQNSHVLVTPLWMTIIRVVQIWVCAAIVAMAARLMHDAYLDEEGLALAISLITWIVVIYALLTEKFTNWHGAYHIVAVLCLDGLMMVLWLATFAAVAAERARYKYKTTVNACFDDGSDFNSTFCFRKRQLEKRDDNVLLFKTGAAMLTAIAGLGALIWLLFIATFVWTLVMFVRGRKQGRFPVSSAPRAVAHNGGHQMGSNAAGSNQMTTAHPAPHAYAQSAPQNTMQQTQMQAGPPPPQQQPYAPSQSPYPQTVSSQPSSGPCSPPAGAYSPEAQASQPVYGQYPPPHQQQHQQPQQQHQQPADAYPQQGYQPPVSPPPTEQNPQHYQQDQAGQYPPQTGSPAPQELHPDPYRPQPQEMPPNAPAYQQQQQQQ